MIGEIFDREYQAGGIGATPLTGIQTIAAPPGGAVIAGRTLSRWSTAPCLAGGLAGFLIVEGPVDNEIMHRGGVAKQGASLP